MKLSRLLVLLMFVLLILVIPTTSAVKIFDGDIEKNGREGKKVTYTMEIQNDRDYYVDFMISVYDSDWETKLQKKEFDNVKSGEIVKLKIWVTIPKSEDKGEDGDEDPEQDSCRTTIYLYERMSTGGFNQYSWEKKRVLTTSIEEKSNSGAVKVLTDNSGILALLLFFGISGGYLWNARYYFFFTPFYHNISEEKLLNSKRREVIMDYLADNTGSTLTEISRGTDIHVSTLRHHMGLMAKTDLVLKKDKKFFPKKRGANVIDTDILSPILQRVYKEIENNPGIPVSGLRENLKRSKPWIGKRVHELVYFDAIEIRKEGRYKYLYAKGTLNERKSSEKVELTKAPIAG